MSEVSRRNFGRTVLSGLGASVMSPALQTPGGRRPNLVFLCSDQHSGLVLGPNGHAVVKTPHLDRLAAMGVNFRNAYCGSPVCVPSRAGFMTGMFPSDVGSYCNSTPFDGRVPTWGQRLSQAGYYCHAAGKLDLQEGLDYGFHEDHTDHEHSRGPDITSLFRAPLCYRRDERRQADGEWRERRHTDVATMEHALAFLRDEAPKQTKPWALYTGLTLPHSQFVALPQYRAMYPPERMPLPDIPPDYLERRHLVFQGLANFKLLSLPVPEARVRRARAAYYGMVTELDGMVGQLLDQLDRIGQLQNTVFVYTADHGEMLGEHGLWLKNNLLEGAARVPLLIAGPGMPRGRTIETPVTHADGIATLLDLAGLPAVRELRGHSLAPLANGRTGSHPGYAYAESHSEGNSTGSFLIRRGDWKYLYFSWDEPLLFNLKDDPGEKDNLAGKPEHAAVQKELHGILTSLVDPDEVTRRAFAEQERRLALLVQKTTPQDFYKMLERRLGPGQAGALTTKYYKGARI
jgi:choline-sulfatase